MTTLFSPGRINSRPSNVIVRGWRREHHMMTPTTCGVGSSLSRTQTLIITRSPLWRLEGATRQWSAIHQNTQPKSRSQLKRPKRLNNVGKLGRTSPRPAFPSEGHGARKCLPSDPCSVRSRQNPYHASVRKGSHQIHILEGGKENTPSNIIRR